MGRFTKYNNPSKRRKPRKIDKTDKMIIAGRGIITDYKLGYTKEKKEEK